MPAKEEYQLLLTEIIQKQAVILGADIAVQKARNVPGLIIGDDGNVSNIDGDADKALQKLIDEYIALSGEIVKNVTKPILDKYPSIKIDVS